MELFCNSFKILEKLVLTNVTPHIPLSLSQHGFRSHHSTTTLTQHINEGLNTPKPAFDPVPRTLLIEKIYNTNKDIHYN